MSVTHPDRLESETGAILPLFAILIIVLLVFAAFTVDLGAAWAERRQLQSAADAGAMAAVLPPLVVGDTIASTAMDFVDANVATPVDRFGCDGWTPATEGVAGTFVLANPSDSNCVWISTETTSNERLVAVKVPVQQVPTAFARVIGIDNIPVDAFAVSQIETIQEAHILPFALTSEPGGHECLGSPPAGISRNPCTGSSTGNFGYITSFFKETADLGTPNSCDPTPGGSMTAADILAMNIAIGTDHPVQNDLKWPADNAGADDDFPDECDGKLIPRYTPDSVVFLTGNQEGPLHSGLVSADTFGSLGTVSRLKQNLSSGYASDLVADTRTIENKNLPDDVIDNVGLWEYVVSGSAGWCSPNADWVAGGEAATVKMEKCLSTGGSLTFSSLLWESPRFAVIPELWSDTFPTGTDSMAIKRFRGVYLQGAWFNCSASGGSSAVNDATACLPFIDKDGNEQLIFFPGEGDEVACEPLGAAAGCKNSQVRGLSAFVLPIASVPDSVINDLSANYWFLYR